MWSGLDCVSLSLSLSLSLSAEVFGVSANLETNQLFTYLYYVIFMTCLNPKILVTENIIRFLYFIYY